MKAYFWILCYTFCHIQAEILHTWALNSLFIVQISHGTKMLLRVKNNPIIMYIKTAFTQQIQRVLSTLQVQSHLCRLEPWCTSCISVKRGHLVVMWHRVYIKHTLFLAANHQVALGTVWLQRHRGRARLGVLWGLLAHRRGGVKLGPSLGSFAKARRLQVSWSFPPGRAPRRDSWSPVTHTHTLSSSGVKEVCVFS